MVFRFDDCCSKAAVPRDDERDVDLCELVFLKQSFAIDTSEQHWRQGKPILVWWDRIYQHLTAHLLIVILQKFVMAVALSVFVAAFVVPAVDIRTRTPHLHMPCGHVQLLRLSTILLVS